MVRSEGYLQSQAAFEQVPITRRPMACPVLLGEVAIVQRGPTFRRGIAELDGQGEVAGGVVVLRTGKDALAAIGAVKLRARAAAGQLPPGVEIVPVYDRSELIHEAVWNLTRKLGAGIPGRRAWFAPCFSGICVRRWWRSSTLPLGVLAAFIVMRYQGISANLLSLGGIAIAIGAMVDAAVVMIENAHKHLEHFHDDARSRCRRT